MIKQGDICLAKLDSSKGHEQMGYRPVLVMQNNILNKHLNTVIIAPITTNLKAKGKLSTYFLEKSLSRLDNDSVVLLHQIRTLDVGRLSKRVSCLPNIVFTQVKDKLKFIF